MGGWRWMDSDDDFQIRKVLPVGPGRTQVLLLGSLGLDFDSKKMYYSRYPHSIHFCGSREDGMKNGSILHWF